MKLKQMLQHHVKYLFKPRKKYVQIRNNLEKIQVSYKKSLMTYRHVKYTVTKSTLNHKIK